MMIHCATHRKADGYHAVVYDDWGVWVCDHAHPSREDAHRCALTPPEPSPADRRFGCLMVALIVAAYLVAAALVGVLIWTVSILT